MVDHDTQALPNYRPPRAKLFFSSVSTSFLANKCGCFMASHTWVSTGNSATVSDCFYQDFTPFSARKVPRKADILSQNMIFF